MGKTVTDVTASLLSWEDRLWSHPAYIHCAISASQVGPTIILVIEVVLIGTASQIYVQLFDDPSCARDILSTGKNTVFYSPDKTMSRHAGLSADDEKKAKKRAKKAQQKQDEQKKGAV